MPPWIPFHLLCIQVSGVLELLGGAGLLVPEPRAQALAGWGLALLLIAVFPANIYMATAGVQLPHLHIAPWVAWLRVALQPLLILAVLWATSARGESQR